MFSRLQCPYSAVVDKFLLVGQPWPLPLKGSIELSFLLQQCPACFVRLSWIVLEIGCTVVSWSAAFRNCSRQLVAFLCNSRLAFSLIRFVRVHILNNIYCIEASKDASKS